MIDVTINRHKGIGGSECAAAIGLSRYKTPLHVYLDKIEPESRNNKTSIAMELGNYLEPFLLQKYEELTGVKCEKPQEMLRNEKYPWLFAHIDGWANETLLEIKTTRFFNEDWGLENTDEIPQEYLIQTAHYCIVCDAYREIKKADILVLSKSDSIIRKYEYKRNAKLENIIIEKTKEFWNNNVMAQIPPLPKNKEDVLRIYNLAIENSHIVATNDIVDVCNKLIETKKRIKEIELEKEILECEIQKFMTNNDLLLDINGCKLATWKNRSSTRLDTKRIKEEQPSIYNEFCKTSENRVFLIK